MHRSAHRTSAPQPFSFDTVKAIAWRRSLGPYEDLSTPAPQALSNLSYAQYQEIHFRPEDALWRGQSRFQVQFYHRGFAYTRQARIYEVLPTGVHEVRYRPSMFTFGRLPRMRLPADLGFAGFSIHYPINSPTREDTVLAFLGASYFRVLGRNQVYGVTARGLAIDSASVQGEEFPYFTDFWLIPPTARAGTLTVYAVLDSPSITGAYRFDVSPGAITQVTVTATLYPRAPIAKLGIAPITSMYLYGSNSARGRFDDWHPQVHDSDGLMMETGGGEWLWRPLENPRKLQVNRYMDDNPRGFGLIQRDRDFADYQDPVARYEERPSYWIQPLGNWGRGGVELVEIPSGDARNYNIDAYWVPAAAVEPHRPISFSYVLSSYLQSGGRWPPGGRALATRIAPAAGQPDTAVRQVVIDFAGGDLQGLDGSQPVRAEISAHGATLSAASVQRLPENGDWRVMFNVKPAGGQPVDLHCYLELYGSVLTETWTDQW